jgi:hypothetical protein
MPWVQKVTENNQWYNEVTEDIVVRLQDGTTFTVTVDPETKKYVDSQIQILGEALTNGMNAEARKVSMLDQHVMAFEIFLRENMEEYAKWKAERNAHQKG